MSSSCRVRWLVSPFFSASARDMHKVARRKGRFTRREGRDVVNDAADAGEPGAFGGFCVYLFLVFFLLGDSPMKKLWKKFVRDEEGATMVEYGLMVALIAVVCITAVTLIGTNLSTVFTDIAGHI